jgi:hypothetical protein
MEERKLVQQDVVRTDGGKSVVTRAHSDGSTSTEEYERPNSKPHPGAEAMERKSLQRKAWAEAQRKAAEMELNRIGASFEYARMALLKGCEEKEKRIAAKKAKRKAWRNVVSQRNLWFVAVGVGIALELAGAALLYLCGMNPKLAEQVFLAISAHESVHTFMSAVAVAFHMVFLIFPYLFWAAAEPWEKGEQC